MVVRRPLINKKRAPRDQKLGRMSNLRKKIQVKRELQGKKEERAERLKRRNTTKNTIKRGVSSRSEELKC